MAGVFPMRVWMRLAVLSVLLGARTAAPAEAPATSPLSSLRLLPPVVFEGDEGFSLEERMRHYKVEAVSIALVRDSTVAWTAAWGLADREAGLGATPATLFQAASISKPVAAAGVLRKVQEGALDLSVDVNTCLKGWKIPETEWTAKRKVSFELLLSHGAGLTVHGFPGYAPGAPVPTLPQVLEGAPPANTGPVRVDLAPGTKWRYSGGGYTVAQLAMVDSFGRPFPELMRDLVLTPAGMAESTFDQPLPAARMAVAAAGYRRDGSPVPGKRHTYPEMAAAGLWTTAGDLARFGVAIQASLAGKHGALLSKELAARMVTPFVGDYGLGFASEKRGTAACFGHGGANAGFQSQLVMSRDEGWGAAVMTNSDSGSRLAAEVLRGLARQYGWKGYLPEPLKRLPMTAGALRSLPGRWQTGGDEAFTIAARDGRLFGTPSAGEEFELLRIGDGLFARRDRGVRYRVEVEGEKTASLALLAGDEEVHASRMEAEAMLPSDLLAAGRLEEAAAAYRALFARKPDDPAVAEPRLNMLGYRFAGELQLGKAIVVLKLNTGLYPASANAWDSLGEVYLLSAEPVRALECYRKVLDLLPGDAKADPALRDQLRRKAEAKVKELERSPAAVPAPGP